MLNTLQKVAYRVNPVYNLWLTAVDLDSFITRDRRSLPTGSTDEEVLQWRKAAEQENNAQG